MHAVVMENLEEYLSGTLMPAALRQFEVHLSSCEVCRQEVAGMQEVSDCFSAFRIPEPVAPPPAFYAKIMREVGQRQSVPLFGGVFALDFAFGRRLVFASLLTLAVLGSYLVSYETGYSSGLSPETVMAQQDSPAFENARDQANMLATLTNYEP